MAVPISPTSVLLPWVRQGAAAGIDVVDTLTSSQPASVSLPVTLRVNGAVDVERPVALHGPGDVIGIDPQQIVRTEPAAFATDFEPNYFPAVDFDRPDFPWLFTPARAGADGRLRPWICLVVVRQQRGVSLRTAPALPLPVLEITSEVRTADELPDLSESWAWAHAHVTGSRADRASLDAALVGHPAFTVSRLLCPRRLDPETAYLACIVPAFEIGRKAGLGLPVSAVDEQALEPAWTSGADAAAGVALPVYFHWTFRTGSGGDFEQLVRVLESRPLPKTIGKRPIDISRSGLGVVPPTPDATTIELEGALRVPKAPPAPWTDETRVPFQAALETVLETPWVVLHEGGDPLVAPPIYGAWHAARHLLRAGGSPPEWLDQLNLDPRARATAALGTAVVQADQERLMASAWEQLGDIQRLNQLRRQAQLGRAVNGVYLTRHFGRMSEESLLKLVAPAQSRLAVTEIVNDPRTSMMLSHRIARTSIPSRAVSAPLRRLTGPRQAVSARFQRGAGEAIVFVARVNTTFIVTPQRRSAGVVTIDDIAVTGGGTSQDPNVRFLRIPSDIETAPTLGDFAVRREGLSPKLTLLAFTPGLPDSPDLTAFRAAARAHQEYVSRAFPTLMIFPAPVSLDMPRAKGEVLQTLDPAKTIASRVRAATAGGRAAPPTEDDPLAPIMDAPAFPQPMYEALRDLSQDFLLPGLDQVPANTVTLLETNAAFVEAFMVGLNTEMARELLWRDYPTDQRGTCFRQFWDTSAGSELPDIEPIPAWATTPLGENARAAGKLTLLVRGELLRRYPGSVIYAVPAVEENGVLNLSADAAAAKHPLFRGTLHPDVTFLGFDLTRPEAIADPGWYFVIQQQPTEPRFGLDAPDFKKPVPPLTSWNDLSWRHLAGTEEALRALVHVRLTTSLPALPGATWGRNAAHQAHITLQRPVRIAIHAREMLEKTPA